jgi:hypothetical protein
LNLRSAFGSLRRPLARSVARFPVGQPGDPTLKILPSHAESIPVRSIVGSVSRHAQLDRRFRPKGTPSSRLRRIVAAMKDDIPLPPIEVYRLHGVCYVVDGHHRVAAALELGQLYLDALVSECLASSEGSEQPLEAARIQFALRTSLRGLSFSAPERYVQALAQIHEHRWYLGERGRVLSLQEAAVDWYDTIYLPVACKMLDEHLVASDAAQDAGDEYLQVCDVKYAMSHEAGHDIGFSQAVCAWAAQHQVAPAPAFLGGLFTLRLMA